MYPQLNPHSAMVATEQPNGHPGVRDFRTHGVHSVNTSGSGVVHIPLNINHAIDRFDLLIGEGVAYSANEELKRATAELIWTLQAVLVSEAKDVWGDASVGIIMDLDGEVFLVAVSPSGQSLEELDRNGVQDLIPTSVLIDNAGIREGEDLIYVFKEVFLSLLDRGYIRVKASEEVGLNPETLRHAAEDARNRRAGI